MSAADVCLGVIVGLLIVLIARAAWRRWGPPARAGFAAHTFGAPAGPRVAEAADALFRSLDGMQAHCHELRRLAAACAGIPDDACETIQGAQSSAAQIADVLAAAKQRFATVSADRRYGGAHAVYRGLAGSDAYLLGGAVAFDDAGHKAHQALDRTALSGVAAATGDLAAAGNTLILMGRQLCRIVGDIHKLGAALDLE